MPRAVSAAEKYAELEAADEARPVCDCHGEPKSWKGEAKGANGGYWTCSVKVRERRRRYREADPEKERAKNRRYQEANPEKARERSRRYRAANPERARHYREANKEKRRDYDRRYQEANPEKARERSRRYRAANPEKVRESGRRYRAANPEKERERNARRISAGRTYLAMAPSVEEAQAIQAYVTQRLTDFRGSQRAEAAEHASSLRADSPKVSLS